MVSLPSHFLLLLHSFFLRDNVFLPPLGHLSPFIFSRLSRGDDDGVKGILSQLIWWSGLRMWPDGGNHDGDECLV